MTLRWMTVVFGALVAGAGGAAAGDKTDVVRDLAGRVGPIVGSALACRDISRPRIQVIVDKFTAVITEASSSEAERSDLTQLLDRSVADRQLGDLERSIAGPGPSLAAVIAPSFATAAATAPTAPVAAVAGPPVRGVSDREIRFG